MLGGVVAINLTLLVVVWSRYSKVGTYEEFHRGATVPLPSSSLGMILNIGGALTAVGTLALWFWSRRRTAESLPVESKFPSFAEKQ